MWWSFETFVNCNVNATPLTSKFRKQLEVYSLLDQTDAAHMVGARFLCPRPPPLQPRRTPPFGAALRIEPRLIHL